MSTGPERYTPGTPDTCPCRERLNGCSYTRLDADELKAATVKAIDGYKARHGVTADHVVAVEPGDTDAGRYEAGYVVIAVDYTDPEDRLRPHQQWEAFRTLMNLAARLQRSAGDHVRYEVHAYRE